MIGFGEDAAVILFENNSLKCLSYFYVRAEAEMAEASYKRVILIHSAVRVVFAKMVEQ